MLGYCVKRRMQVCYMKIVKIMLLMIIKRERERQHYLDISSKGKKKRRHNPGI